MRADDRWHVPDLMLEQYRLNELPADAAGRLEQRLRNDRSLRSRLDAMATSDADIARTYPSDWLAQRIRARVSAAPAQTPQRVSRRLALGSAFAMVVLALLVPLAMMTIEGDRIKGLAPSLAVYRRTAQGSEKLADGALARAGDLLRVGYVSAGRDYGLILSLDGRGVVTRHLPVDGNVAVALRNDGTVLLDNAYELDDAPAWERFYFVTADEPFDVGPVLAAAQRAAAAAPRLPPSLSLVRRLRQSTFTLQKEVKP
jgi:hypothetical protein